MTMLVSPTHASEDERPAGDLPLRDHLPMGSTTAVITTVATTSDSPFSVVR